VVEYLIAFRSLQGFFFLFTDTFNFSTSLTGTAFSALSVGIPLNTSLAPVFARHHPSLLKRRGPTHKGEEEELPPEYHLFPIALTLPTSLFWLAWANYPRISPFSSLSAIALFGFS